jgi:ComF family protein
VPFRNPSDKRAMISSLVPLRWALDFALPPRCPACREIAVADDQFCSGCWAKLNFLAQPACATCDLPLPFADEHARQCGGCLASPPRHSGIKAAVAYDDISRDVALRLKHGGRIGLARLIGGQLRRYLADVPADALLVPVPLHWTRLWARSYNQSALIARELAKHGGQRHIPDLLIRTKRTPSLGGLGAKARRQAVKGIFRIRSKYQAEIKGRHIVLVDDVYTSGATTDGCVAALKKAGAASVSIFCWARVLPEALETEAFDSAILD